MIIDMAKVRILGPRDRLEGVLDALQDSGLVHLVAPRPSAEVRPAAPGAGEGKEARRLREILESVEWCLARLPGAPADAGDGAARSGHSGAAGRDELAGWARLGRRLRRELEALEEEESALEEERGMLARYLRYFAAFDALVGREPGRPAARVHHLILRGGDGDAAGPLRVSLADVIGEDFELLTAPLEDGDVAVALVVPARAADRVEGILARAGIQELPVPAGYGDGSPGEAAPAMRARLEEASRRLAEIGARREALGRAHGADLRRARRGLRDRLLELEALEAAARTERAFVLEGWLPAVSTHRLARALRERFGTDVVVEPLSTEEWEGEAVPVVLSNPRLFRPFEAITRMLPLPRYGSIDPTPFVATFFPMFFGVILGDVGYGAVLALVSGILHLRSKPETLLRSVAEIGGACAAFSIVFGLLYGELFGDLGRQWFGLQPLAFDREEALLPFLVLAVALGLIHILLGLVLGAVASFRGHPREAVGRGIAALMVVLIVLALLAAVRVLPAAFFTPVVVALLVAFPVLVVAEGIIAPIELLSTLGNILSYARIMALGTASVMMAVVANRLVGALGGAVVGVLFGLLFHMVNFALGVFGPTIHGLRLHYVEFFGKFYSPGGIEYRPLRHWRPEGDG